MTILELATDLDVPKSGEAWHELRSGELPKDIKHNLSDTLVDIIEKMLNPNYLTRPSVDELLEIPTIKSIVNSRKRKIKLLKLKSYAYLAYQKFMNFLLSIWYFIIDPIKRKILGSFKHTSTPMRLNDAAVAPVQLLNNFEDDDYDGKFLFL